MAAEQDDICKRLCTTERLMDTLDAIWKSSAPDAEKSALGIYAVNSAMAFVLESKTMDPPQRLPLVDATTRGSTDAGRPEGPRTNQSTQLAPLPLQPPPAPTRAARPRSRVWVTASEASSDEGAEPDCWQPIVACDHAVKAEGLVTAAQGCAAECSCGAELAESQREPHLVHGSATEGSVGSRRETVLTGARSSSQTLQHNGKADREIADQRAHIIKVCPRCQKLMADKYFAYPQWWGDYGTCRRCSNYWDGFDYMK